MSENRRRINRGDVSDDDDLLRREARLNVPRASPRRTEPAAAPLPRRVPDLPLASDVDSERTETASDSGERNEDVTFENAEFENELLSDILRVTEKPPFYLTLESAALWRRRRTELARDSIWFKNLNHIPQNAAILFARGGRPLLDKELDLYQSLGQARTYKYKPRSNARNVSMAGFNNFSPFLSQIAHARALPLTRSRPSYAYSPGAPAMPFEEAMDRLRWAADVIPRVSKLNTLAAREYLDTIGKEFEDVPEDEEEEEEDEDEIPNDDILFDGVIPGKLAVGLRAFKPPSRDKGYFVGIKTHIMQSSGSGVAWSPACTGGAKNLKQLQTETAVAGWTAVKRPSIEYVPAEMNEILKYAGRSPDLLTYLNDAGLANAGQIFSMYGYMIMMTRGRLIFRAIWGDREKGEELMQLIMSGDPMVAATMPKNLFVSFSTCGNVDRPIRYASGEEPYQTVRPFAAVFGDALGSDALGTIINQYVENVYEHDTNTMYLNSILTQLYGANAQGYTAEQIAVEYPVWNPFCAAYYPSQKSYRMIETRADFVSVIKDAGGAVKGYVVGEYKPLVELRRPNQRVPAQEHLTQAVVNAFLLYLCTGIRADFSVILYPTRRYPNDDMPRAYAAVIDLRFLANDAETNKRRASLWKLYSKLCFAPFEPAAVTKQQQPTIYVDDAFAGIMNTDEASTNIILDESRASNQLAAMPELVLYFHEFFKINNRAPASLMLAARRTALQNKTAAAEDSAGLPGFKKVSFAFGMTLKNNSFHVQIPEETDEIAYDALDEFGCSIQPPLPIRPIEEDDTGGSDGGGGGGDGGGGAGGNGPAVPPTRAALTKWNDETDSADIRQDILDVVPANLQNTSALDYDTDAQTFFSRNQRHTLASVRNADGETYHQEERGALEEEIYSETARVYGLTSAILPDPRTLFRDLLAMEEFGVRPPGNARNQLTGTPDVYAPGTSAPFNFAMNEQDVIRRTIERLVNAVVQDAFPSSRFAQSSNYAEGFIHNSQRLYWKEDVLNFANEHLVRKAGDAIVEEIALLYS